MNNPDTRMLATSVIRYLIYAGLEIMNNWASNSGNFLEVFTFHLSNLQREMFEAGTFNSCDSRLLRSILFSQLTLDTIPIGVAYAVWSGSWCSDHRNCTTFYTIRKSILLDIGIGLIIARCSRIALVQ